MHVQPRSVVPLVLLAALPSLASAQAVAVTASAEAGAGTTGARTSAGAGSPNTAAGGGYTKGMQIFTMAEGGLMYKATIAGQRYNFTPAEE